LYVYVLGNETIYPVFNLFLKKFMKSYLVLFTLYFSTLDPICYCTRFVVLAGIYIYIQKDDGDCDVQISHLNFVFWVYSQRGRKLSLRNREKLKFHEDTYN